jgi:hypothetical protein
MPSACGWLDEEDCGFGISDGQAGLLRSEVVEEPWRR